VQILLGNGDGSFEDGSICKNLAMAVMAMTFLSQRCWTRCRRSRGRRLQRRRQSRSCRFRFNEPHHHNTHGNGDGTFTVGTPIKYRNASRIRRLSSQVVAADFNGDGKTDVAVVKPEKRKDRTEAIPRRLRIFQCSRIPLRPAYGTLAGSLRQA